ncbi:MAG: hypothetical protein AABN34_09380 [Acidobacteriota bacterium]
MWAVAWVVVLDVVTFLPAWIGGPAQIDPRPRVASDQVIERIQPSALSGLPRQITHFLASGRYTIPVVAENPHHQNVVRGQFARRGQRDWAVLASRGGYSTIVVFWGGSTRKPAFIARKLDSAIRVIAKAGPRYILEHYRAYGGPKPPSPLDHDGIDDGYYEKASMVLYLHRGKWYELQGSD